MSLLAMFLGIGVGCVMFIGYAFALLCQPYSETQKEEWLASLTKEERESYWFHERRKREWIKLRKRQHKICMALRQTQYDETGHDHYWECWGTAAEQVGINAYKDVWAAKDCPITKWDGNWPINCWRDYKPLPPVGTTDDWRASVEVANKPASKYLGSPKN